MRPFRLLSLAAVTAAAGAAAVAACGDPFGLLPPAIANAVDSSVSLYALTGTPPATPSGYRLDLGQAVLTQESTSLTPFDFAFDIDTAGRAVLLPTGALRLGRASGIQISAVPFDSIRLAPGGSYQLDSAVVVDSGTVAVLHSRPTSCGFGLAAVYYFYAKLQVLRVDSVSRRLDFQILIDKNCGYRGLEPGLPRR
jgi:hypothetical protein